MKQSYLKWIIGVFVIIVAAAAGSMLNFGDNVVYFYTPKEALAQSDELSVKTIKVGGMVKAGSVDWQPTDIKLAFTLSDMKGSEITINHNGTPPDMFKENQGVVVEGRISSDGKQMVAKRLMVKHSEEYKKPDDHSSMNKALLEESIFKNEKY
ncbi:cytochrome c maturation protein CcmE [Pseudobacteriovorax antillogorgiicola]|uniref:Cytochrome c-type biogenesis protein CcmE n=1 Tax=Pseudobacteriovorax antillogorgiicola TaxID=1513793 RepID=A0A1Y6C033_9BACT|nr:cytochrome c maturation protein CcmE [Pseudobacteriovorax antillogorgiicola]TCS52352.1 cytochrome c-type biogenesis protein CcmE [Pseudobacteriovorax antillogorgiicola]SMF29566.1 cytochrome c-type biogenesis protein CcmE [Pseudobacteriovorax antillogorgiicola]